MVSLIIDAANDKILFKLINLNKTYTNEYTNSKKNFDRFSLLLIKFLKKNRISLNQIKCVLVNQGPGKFSSIRSSIASIKAFQLVYNFNFYGFSSNMLPNKDYSKLLETSYKKKLTKKLIKPLYYR